MKNQWIVVANASLARFFERGSPEDPMVALPTMEHPESRLKGSELAPDRDGHEATDHASGNRFEPRSDVRRKEHQRFAREVAERLDTALNEGRFTALWLCASDPFLGELKAALGEAVARHVQVCVDHDYTALGLSELEQRLQQVKAKA